MAKQIKLDVGNGIILCAEANDADGYKEIYLSIEGDGVDGVQDIACLSAEQTGWNKNTGRGPEYGKERVSLKVWTDETNDSWTEEHNIPVN